MTAPTADLTRDWRGWPYYLTTRPSDCAASTNAPVPCYSTPRKRAEFDKAMDEVDRQAAERWGPPR